MTEIISQRRTRRFTLSAAPEQVLELAWGAATDVGLKRSVNEDSVVAMAGIVAVADGLGGHSAGDVASAAAVDRLAEKGRSRARRGAIFERDDVIDALVSASEDIAVATRDTLHGSGTTVTGLAVVEHEGVPSLQIFNLGDSRVYVYRDGGLRQLTRDHSYVQDLVDSGQLAPEDAEGHPDANIITRALGFGEVPEVDRWVMHPKVGMRFLVCSDGLTRELSDATIRALLAVGEPPAETAASLVAAAVDSGGRDNVTVAIVDVLEAPSRSSAGQSGPALSDTAVL